MNITVVGIGYVGLSISVLLSQYNHVYALDINKKKVDMINDKRSPIKDEYIEKYLIEKELNLTATTNEELAYSNADFIIIAVPTDYNNRQNKFNTSIIENVIKQIFNYNNQAIIIIKSTVPIGFTKDINKKYNCENIIFSPEFLRESKALYDNLYPSRIVVGLDNNKLLNKAHMFVDELQKCALKENIETFFVGSMEAESIKLFSNAYLAMRISFFNELDTYAESKNLNSIQIIEGVCADGRIGKGYNNPSFGYGGYCLPKDTKQLLSDFGNTPQNIMQAIIKSNNTRKTFISNKIISLLEKIDKKHTKTIGIYKLAMKNGSDNFRQSSVQDIIKKLKDNTKEIIIYEPILNDKSIFLGAVVVNDFNEFKKRSDIIIANRYDECLSSVKYKVYTRDLFNGDN